MLGVQGLDLIRELLQLCESLSSFVTVELRDFLGRRLLLVAHRVEFRLELTAAAVEVEDLVDGRRDASPGEGLAHRVRVGADEVDVDHARSARG